MVGGGTPISTEENEVLLAKSAVLSKVRNQLPSGTCSSSISLNSSSMTLYTTILLLLSKIFFIGVRWSKASENGDQCILPLPSFFQLQVAKRNKGSATILFGDKNATFKGLPQEHIFVALLQYMELNDERKTIVRMGYSGKNPECVAWSSKPRFLMLVKVRLNKLHQDHFL